MDLVEPQTTLAIVLGASDFPRSPNLHGGEIFAQSATGFAAFLMAPDGFGLPNDNLLNLFDSPLSPDDIDDAVGEFLDLRREQLSDRGAPAKDVIVYYVGHGGFTRKDKKYYLATRTTRQEAEGASSIRMSDFATTLTEHARELRRYLILDCCFAATAFIEFQSGIADATRRKTLDEFPERGTAMLCASSSQDFALAPRSLRRTMFSDALLTVLATGIPEAPLRLSLEEIGAAVRQFIRVTYAGEGVRPEVSSPDQREGRVADIPLFPNRAVGRSGQRADIATGMLRNIVPPAPPTTTQVVDLAALYEKALEAYWAERWEAAIELLSEYLRLQPHRTDVTEKLERARSQRSLAVLFADALAAAERQDWEAAASGFQAIVNSDPLYRDAAKRLDYSVRQHKILELHAEARRLAHLEAWGAVANIGERLHEIDPSAADPAGVVSKAKAELAAAARATALSTSYMEGLRLLDEGKWQGALDALLRVADADPAYRDVAALVERARRELSPQELKATTLARLESVTIEPSNSLALLMKFPAVDEDRAHLTYSVAITSDGARLATGEMTARGPGGKDSDWDGQVRIWEVATGRNLLHLKHREFGHDAPIVTFSPDGRWLATASRGRSTWQLWDAMRGAEVWTTHPWRSVGDFALAFSPDSRLIAVGSDDSSEVKVFDLATRRERGRLIDQVIITNDLAFNGDASLLAVAGQGTTIWNLAANTVQTKVGVKRTHIVGEYTRAVRFSPDNQALATAEGRSARISNAKTGGRLATLPHSSDVGTLEFSPNGRFLATGDKSGNVRIWSIRNETAVVKMVHRHDKTRHAVEQLAFSRDGKLLVTCYLGQAYLWAFDESVLPLRSLL